MDLASQLRGCLSLAVPKKGRLHEQCLSLLKGADLVFRRKNRLDIAMVQKLPVVIVFLPAADIAKFVGDGNVDMGMTGEDMIAEAGVDGKVIRIAELGFGKCKLQVQVPQDDGPKTVEELVGGRIVTSFKTLAEKYFAEIDKRVLTEEELKEGKGTKIQYVSGSVEVACALGLADGVVDLVESGETMRAAGLHAISTILSTQAILIGNKHPSNPELVTKISSRILGVVASQKYVLLNYNIERVHLKQATLITPGRRAPTISPLEEGDWVEVQAMVLKDEVARKMDELQTVGAHDILVFNISNCRV
ncbi:5026_t:CDS:2 [Paraglomus occultum]|uniref:ATP phosphoribosyltransferase n=1 Tax=Paraglomus occultum TaxID=144539 RepID=A0A9N9BH05_9GLOM|nr:5026_t:CDS:2 [Paraglomus occultum]